MRDGITGGDAIVRALIANGVDTVFGLPGVQTYPIFDALARNKNAIRTITARHEQAAAYMAFGYARSTGRPGVYSVVPGPGVLNTTAALCTAFGANAPVLCLTGQVPSPFLGKLRGHLHELPDQLATLRSLIKGAERIDRPADAPAAVNKAFRKMLSGRPGPVSLEMCWNTMAWREEVDDLPPSSGDLKLNVDPGTLARAVDLIANAKQVMIMTGGGAQHAGAEIRDLAETLNAPVTAFRGGKGVVPDDHDLAISSVAAYDMWPEVDLLIGIGSRLEMPYMRWSGMMKLVERPEAPPHLIRIDIDPVEMQRLVPHVGLVTDAARGANALTAALKERGVSPLNGRRNFAEIKADARRQIEKIQPQMAYLDVIRAVLPRDGFLVEEISQMGFTAYYGYPTYAPRTFVSSGYQGTLGFGYPTALGVKIAHPDKPVISLNGDGGFMFGVQELATAMQHNIGVVALVFNNSAFGNVRRDQKRLFDGRVLGSELQNPDFLKLADSFGMAAHRVASPEALRPVLRDAIAADAPCLIEIEIEENSETSPWEFIHRV